MLDTTIVVELFVVPVELTTKQNKHNVRVDYSCECYLDDEGNVGHKGEVFAFLNFDAFYIDNEKYPKLIELVRCKAEEKFNSILMNQLSFN